MTLNLSEVDVEDFLNELGMNNVRDEGSDVWYSCFSDAHYRGDANPSASMRKGDTAFYCFSCGMKGNAITFLSELENVSPIQAAIWIKERWNIDTAPKQESLVSNVKDILNEKPATKTYESLTHIDEKECSRRFVDWKDIVKKFNNKNSSQLTDLPGETWEDIFTVETIKTTPLFYMLERGFKPETLEEWGIGWDNITERISIPIRDEDGKLVGFKARTTDPNKKDKYIVLGGSEFGFEPYQTKKIVFGLDRAIRSERFLTEKYRLIVREGELNVIALHEKGFKNSCGISGKFLSEEQINLIRQFAREVVLWFDDEEDALNNALKIRTKIPTSIVPQQEFDPADMDATQITWALQSRKSSLISYN